MTFFILFLFIFFIVAPIVSAMYKIWSFRRRIRRFTEDPFGQSYHQQDYERKQRQQQWERTGKRIPHDVGEYVTFTEYEASTRTKTGGSSGHKTYKESQITDVEWVDIEK